MHHLVLQLGAPPSLLQAHPPPLAHPRSPTSLRLAATPSVSRLCSLPQLTPMTTLVSGCRAAQQHCSFPGSAQDALFPEQPDAARAIFTTEHRAPLLCGQGRCRCSYRLDRAEHVSWAHTALLCAEKYTYDLVRVDSPSVVVPPDAETGGEGYTFVTLGSDAELPEGASLGGTGSPTINTFYISGLPNALYRVRVKSVNPIGPAALSAWSAAVGTGETKGQGHGAGITGRLVPGEQPLGQVWMEFCCQQRPTALHQTNTFGEPLLWSAPADGWLLRRLPRRA